jgi:hypothetical protein
VVGNLAIAAGRDVGHGAVIESGGPPVHLQREVVVMANSVIRSLGGGDRPALPSERRRWPGGTNPGPEAPAAVDSARHEGA